MHGRRSPIHSRSGFAAYERQLADRTLRDYYPDAYERVVGVTLPEGRSNARDAQEFERRHRND